MAVSSKSDNSPTIEINNFRKKILTWYDKHQRALPWRTPSNKSVNKKSAKASSPYHVWLSEIMLQQTTVVTVGPYFQNFVDKWPSIHDLAKAKQEDVLHEWAGLGYYARARNLHKCAQIVSVELKGIFPENQKELEKLPGIGSYTSAALRAIAFNKPANVVDGNIERVMARLYAVKKPLPDSKPALKSLAAELSEDQKNRPGDYAQALMDLGATICTPTSPRCVLCPVKALCSAKAKGIAETLPVRKPKKPKPHKYGEVYWILNENEEILFIRRGEKEMLGGMLGLPTSQWLEKKAPKSLPLSIKHSFTHFDLTLRIKAISLSDAHKKGIIPPEKDHLWVPIYKLEKLGLPTLFAKVVKLMK